MERLGWRFTSLTVTFLICLGLSTSAIVPNIQLFYLTFGIIQGKFTQLVMVQARCQLDFNLYYLRNMGNDNTRIIQALPQRT